MNFLRAIFAKDICVAVFVTNEDYDTFNEVLTDSVRHYKVDRLRIGDDVIFAFKLKEHRYRTMIDACAEAGIPLVVYSKVRYLHRIVK